jgi:hypothetical protein
MGLTPATLHSATQWQGWLPQGAGGTALGRDSHACLGRGARPVVSEH